MHAFLEAVADRISTKNTEDHLVVLPTGRSGSFFRRILAERLKPGQFLPEVITPLELASRITGFLPAESLVKTFTLYEAYAGIMGTEAVALTEFMSWSDILSSDFSDIDSGLLEPEQVFKELADYTEIEHFSFLEEPLSEKQLAFRKFWKSLPAIYQSFTKSLAAKGLATSGMIMKRASAEIGDFLEKEPRLGMTIAGFNAFTEAEFKLFQAIENADRGKVYYDADTAYLTDATHAGLFIDKNLKRRLGTAIYPETSLSDRPVTLRVVSALNRLDQVNAVAAILEGMSMEEIRETCLVLADESLLLPLIERLPKKIEEVNVTMGLKITDFFVAKWVDSWLELMKSARIKDKLTKFPADNLRRFLENPLNREMGMQGDLDVSDPYISMEEIGASGGVGKLHEILALSENSSPESKELFESLARLIRKGDTSDLEVQAAIVGFEKISEFFGRLAGFAEAEKLDWKNLGNLIRSALKGERLSLIGEPATGLQIMGVLETQTLGFSEVIMVSVEEGSFPKTSAVESFIPFEIRLHHRLPGKREKEAIYAYHFYRILSHSNRFTAVYHTDAGPLEGGEMSRYLLQMEYLSSGWPRARFEHLNLSHPKTSITASEKRIEKSSEVIDLIKKSLTVRGLSASSINRYRESSLEWYYTYVLSLKESKEDVVDAAIFGSIVHQAIDDLFDFPPETRLKSKDLNRLIGAVENTLRKAFRTYAPKANVESGLNRIHYETALRMISAYLKHLRADIERGAKVDYLEGEKCVTRDLRVKLNGEELVIPVKGYIDRLERYNGVLRIIDFKTGSVEQKDLKVKVDQGDDPAEAISDQLKKLPKALQLMLYEWLLQDEFATEKRESLIISMLAPGNDKLRLKVGLEAADYLAHFEAFLKETVREMLDPTDPIIYSEDFEYRVFE